MLKIKLLLMLLFSNFVIDAIAESELSDNGVNFSLINSPITLEQHANTNQAAIIEKENITDSAITQTGFDNRGVIIQFSDDNLAILRQPGLFNRALIVQIGNTENYRNATDLKQGGATALVNNLFVFQTWTKDEESDVIHQEFAKLNPKNAKLVANNFIYGPNLSRVNVNLLEDLGLHFHSLLTNHLDNTRSQFENSNNIHLFTLIGRGNSDRDSTNGILGYQHQINSATIGADLYFNANAKLGLALNIENSNGNIHHGLGAIDTTGYQIGGFSSFKQNNYYLDLIASFGKINFSTERLNDDAQTQSDIDGWIYAGRSQVGYSFNLNNLRISPLLAIGYSQSKTPAYWEDGSLLTKQWLSKQVQKGLVASIGSNFEQQTYFNLPIYSHLKIELEHNFQINDQKQIDSKFAFAPNTVIITPYENYMQDNYGKISGGIDFNLNKQVKFSLNGIWLISAKQINQKNIYAGLLIDF